MGWSCQSIVVKLDTVVCLCKRLFFNGIWLERLGNILPCAVCLQHVKMFPTWPPQQHRVAWGTCLFLAANTLVKNVNIGNQTPLTTLELCGVIPSACTFICSTLVVKSTALFVGPNSRSCFFLCGALKTNNDYRLRGRMENLAQANHL